MRINLSLLYGLAGAVAVVWFGVLQPSQTLTLFLDPRILIIVLGGTLAAGLIAFPIASLVSLFDMLIFTLFFNRRRDLTQTAGELLFLAVLYKDDFQHFRNVEITHPYLGESFKIIANENLLTEDIREILFSRAAAFQVRYQKDAKLLQSLAKLPPAFGLICATTFLLPLVANFATVSTEQIGHALLMALVATLWGVGLSYILFLPLADHANRIAADDLSLRQMVAEAVVAVREDKHHDTVVEILRSYLSPQQRAKLQPISLAQVQRQIRSAKAS